MLHTSKFRRILALACAAAITAQTFVAQAAPPTSTDAKAWLSRWVPHYERLYRYLHQHPELSFQEEQTAAVVARDLAAYGYEVTPRVGGHGVVGVLRNGPGKTVMLRGDMDALAIAEQTGLPYRSRATAKNDRGETVPVMHACGHDLHTTNLLATAAFLASQRTHWRGTLMIVAQPAEEKGAGALLMIQDGLFKRFPRPDYTLALHVSPEWQTGHVAIASGWAAANADTVNITFYGRSGHGSRPHQAIDPILIASHFVTAVQSLVSRRLDPQLAGVVTVGSFHGGAQPNAIPDQVSLALTVRSYSDEVRNLLIGGVRNTAKHVAETFAAPRPPEVKVKADYTPAVYNDPQLASEAKAILTSALGDGAVHEAQPPMTAEDFGRYGRTLGVPSLLIRLGVTSPAALRAAQRANAAPLPSVHSSKFAPSAAAALATGVTTLSALTLQLLSPNKSTEK